MTSGLTETMGDDVRSAIVQFRQENPEHAGVPVIWASTPDYCGSLQEGYAAAVEAIVATLPEGGATVEGQVTVLPGAHLTPAEVEEIKDICEAFGLDPVVVPDISCALDGHIDETVSALSMGGAPVERIRRGGTERGDPLFRRFPLSGRRDS